MKTIILAAILLTTNAFAESLSKAEQNIKTRDDILAKQAVELTRQEERLQKAMEEYRLAKLNYEKEILILNANDQAAKEKLSKMTTEEVFHEFELAYSSSGKTAEEIFDEFARVFGK